MGTQQLQRSGRRACSPGRGRLQDAVPPTPRAREFLSRVLCLWNEHTALTRGVNSALRDAGQCPLRPGLTHAPAALCRFESVTRDCPVLKQRELHVSPGRLSFGCTWRTLGDSANLRTGF